MNGVTELGYLGIGVSDLDAWRRYATQIVGMQLVDDSAGAEFYLRMDQWHHRIAVHKDSSDDLLYMGWRVAGPEELYSMKKRLEEAGVKVRRASDEEADERKVLGLLKLEDPAGNPTEIFFAPRVDAHLPFHPGRPLFGKFITGDQGLGHCIIRQMDAEKAYEFYRLLGLTGYVEYRLPLPNGMVAQPWFMHCNPRQHSLAFGFGPAPKRINHLLIEYSSLDDLGQTHDLIRDQGVEVALQLGKHANDHALTFYAANPSKWLFEFAWGARPALNQQEHYVSDIFGHGNESAGFGVDLPLRERR